MAVEVSKYSLLLTFFLALCKNAMNVRRLFSSTQYISIVRFAVNPEAKNYFWGWVFFISFLIDVLCIRHSRIYMFTGCTR